MTKIIISCFVGQEVYCPKTPKKKMILFLFLNNDIAVKLNILKIFNIRFETTRKSIIQCEPKRREPRFKVTDFVPKNYRKRRFSLVE